MDRKKFIQQGLLMGGTALLAPNLVQANFHNESLFNPDEINEFVSAAHNDADKTRKMVDQNPLILNCASQISRGDFETAIGGASHMGRQDIADILVQRGARLDIFNLTFLGYTEVVKNLIEVSPHYLNAYGPHGFTLLHHAKVGNHPDFANWLENKGLKEDIFKDIF